MEKRGPELIGKFTDRDDRARIYYQFAHVHAQTDITRYSDRVTKYARLALEQSRDPVQRGMLHSYQGSAAEVNPAGGSFAERRRHAAEHLLTGYAEIMQLRLPKVPPELPAVGKFRGDIEDPVQIQKLKQQNEEQLKARREAEFIRELVARRETLTEQLRYLYGREPTANAELRRLAETIVAEPKAVADLLARATPKPVESPIPFEDQVKNAETKIRELKLVEVATMTQSTDTRNPIKFNGKAGEVTVAAGSAVLVELPKPARELTWRWGDITDVVGDNHSPPFSHVLCKWDSVGRLTWVTYRGRP